MDSDYTPLNSVDTNKSTILRRSPQKIQKKREENTGAAKRKLDIMNSDKGDEENEDDDEIITNKKKKMRKRIIESDDDDDDEEEEVDGEDLNESKISKTSSKNEVKKDYRSKYILPGIIDSERQRNVVLSRLKLAKAICESLPLYKALHGSLPKDGATASHTILFCIEPQTYFDLFASIEARDLNFSKKICPLAFDLFVKDMIKKNPDIDRISITKLWKDLCKEAKLNYKNKEKENRKVFKEEKNKLIVAEEVTLPLSDLKEKCIVNDITLIFGRAPRPLSRICCSYQTTSGIKKLMASVDALETLYDGSIKTLTLKYKHTIQIITNK